MLFLDQLMPPNAPQWMGSVSFYFTIMDCCDFVAYWFFNNTSFPQQNTDKSIEFFHLWSNWDLLIFSLLFGEGNGNPLQFFCLENPMDRGAWWAAVHRVTKSQTRLSDFTLTKSVWGFPGGSESKPSTCNMGELGSIPGSGRSPGEGNGNPFQ